MCQFIHRGTPRILAERDREALAEHLRCKPEELKHDAVPPRRAPSRERKSGRPAAPKGFITVPRIDACAAAGPGGRRKEPEQTKEPWLLPDPLIPHELRARPEELRMITVGGDAMEPVLLSRDRILIDATQQAPVPPGVLAIWDGTGLVAKRIGMCPTPSPRWWSSGRSTRRTPATNSAARRSAAARIASKLTRYFPVASSRLKAPRSRK